jgi:uncharacterized protein YbcI
MRRDLDVESAGGSISQTEAREIARVAGGLWKTKVGRGPEHVKVFASDEFIAMVFRNVLTDSERAMTKLGNAAMVRNTRRQIFEVNRAELIEAVEQTSGRSVLTALYDNSPEADLSGFVFVLERD